MEELINEIMEAFDASFDIQSEEKRKFSFKKKLVNHLGDYQTRHEKSIENLSFEVSKLKNILKGQETKIPENEVAERRKREEPTFLEFLTIIKDGTNRLQQEVIEYANKNRDADNYSDLENLLQSYFRTSNDLNIMISENTPSVSFSKIDLRSIGNHELPKI